MFRVIFILLVLLFSISHADTSSAQEETKKRDILKKIEEMVFGEEKTTGTVSVDSDPQGALVYVDNVLKGKTPVSVSGVGPGRLTIRVELEGYETHQKELEIQEGEIQVLNFLLYPARRLSEIGVTISADRAPPGVEGTTVTFTAAGSGGTGEYEYHFFKKGPATGGKWITTQPYSNKNTWTWKTTAADIGSNQIWVDIRRAGSKAAKEAHSEMTYTINRVEDPNIRIIRNFFEYFARGDWKAIRSIMAADVEWHIPGHHPFAGTKKGVNEIMVFLKRLQEANFKAKVLFLGADDKYVVDVHRGWGELKGHKIDTNWVLFYEIRSGKIVRVEDFPGDQHAADMFFWKVYPLLTKP